MSIYTLSVRARVHLIFFFFNDTATTEIYTLSLHDALPISVTLDGATSRAIGINASVTFTGLTPGSHSVVLSRSEEHTSELQSRLHLVCRLLLEKKKKLAPVPNLARHLLVRWRDAASTACGT